MSKPLTVEVVSDVICPWCYIGKRRLEKALSLLDGEGKPEIRVALSSGIMLPAPAGVTV